MGEAFSVFKDTRGQYRWVLRSSNAFRDRDGEIVSTKALEADVARSEERGDFGPLRWWHVEEPAPIDLGTCDWRMVHGRTLIESGTFKSEAIGRAVKAAADRLQVSIGFYHPADQPDPNGVFHTIRVYERSLLPLGRAANPFTKVFVKGDEMATKEEKLAALKMLGVDPDEILSGAEQTEKELDGQRVAFKGEAEDAPTEEAEEEPTPGAEPPAAQETTDELDVEPLLGDMSVKEYAALLTRILAPLAAERAAAGERAEKEASQAAERSEKEAAERAALKELLGKQEQVLAAQAQTVKELQARLDELEGSAPRAARAYRASEDPANVLSDAEMARMKEAGNLPATDPLVGDFLGNFLGLAGK